MADLYYQPRATQYQSQYVPMPLDFMQKALESKQAKWDATQLAMDQLSDKEFNALQGEDTKKAQAVKKKIDDFVDASVGRDIGSSEFAREFTALEREIKKDKDLAAVQSAYAKQQELQKMKEDWIAEGKTLESMPEVWYEADRRLKEYIQGKGYKGDVRLLGVGDISPGVDVIDRTQKFFENVAKNSTQDPQGWGISVDRIDGEAQRMFNLFLGDAAGQQLMKRYDAEQEQWAGSIANLSREKNEVRLDQNGNAVKDAEGNPIMYSEYDKYLLGKKQYVYDIFRNTGLQRVGVKVEDADDGTKGKDSFVKIGDAGGTNVAATVGVSAAEKSITNRDLQRQFRSLKEKKKELEAIPVDERTKAQQRELEVASDAITQMKTQVDNLNTRVRQTTKEFAVQQKVVSNKEEWDKVHTDSKLTLENGEYANELNTDLNKLYTTEELDVIKTEIDKAIEKMPAGKQREQMRNKVVEALGVEGGVTYDGVINAISIIEKGLGWLPTGPMSEMMTELMIGNSVKEQLAESYEGEGKVLTKANQLNAYLDASNYQYEDGIVTIGEEYSPGENSIWTRNAILADFKTNNTLNQYDNKEQVLNAFDRVFADKSKYSEETINQARQVISNLYDAKGDTSWEDLQSKADEYNTVSKQIRLDDKVDDLKWEEKPEDSANGVGKFADTFRETFNAVVTGTDVQYAEVLYSGEEEDLNKLFPPKSILTDAVVRDKNGEVITEENLKAQIANNIGIDPSKIVSLTSNKTNWNKRLLNPDVYSDIRFDGTIDFNVSYIDADGKTQKYDFNSGPVNISTGQNIKTQTYVDNLISRKIQDNAEYEKDFRKSYKDAKTDRERLNLLEAKVNFQNENSLEIARLDDPVFYRQMSSLKQTMAVSPDKPQRIQMSSVIEGGEANEVFEIKRDNDGLFNLTFKSISINEDGETTEAVSKTYGPYDNYAIAMNEIYNYRRLIREDESSIILGRETDSDRSIELMDQISEEYEEYQ
jgi:hypothetical protein